MSVSLALLSLSVIACAGCAMAQIDKASGPAKEQAGKPSQLTLTSCEIPGIQGSARCGELEVFENRATQKGRKIRLKIVVFPATGAERASDPFVYIPGGPGSSATEDARGIVPAFDRIRERRDLVFVDQRGTGGSHPLNCDLFNPSDPQSYLGYFFPLDDVKKCREQLERKADLTLYTTPIAMDDLDEVRAALGYERINILGASYGTRAALVYLKQHPTSVRTLTLHGVAPTNEFMPLAFAQSNERALLGIINECAADEACNKAFPNLRSEWKALLDRLLQGPVEVEVQSQKRVNLSRDLAAEAIRYMLYSPRGADRVPLVLHLAAQGNYSMLAQAALNYRKQIVASGSNGLYLSITCAEDLPWIKAGEGERLAANTFLGDYRLKQQREACTLWPRATLRADYSQPTKGSAPVLILTGEWDPVTPPANGDAVAQHLPNSLHVVVPDGAHGFGGLEGIDCIQRLNTEFIERGAVEGLDTSCVKNIHRKGFAPK
ncbi:MAG TPA: alpha/beta fold hydrolase [Pyrinomonadaceae bacterium]|nr:alpha/beta fold hydrolase [Pyrinomonadaceae bacterium]